MRAGTSINNFDFYIELISNLEHWIMFNLVMTMHVNWYHVSNIKTSSTSCLTDSGCHSDNDCHPCSTGRTPSCHHGVCHCKGIFNTRHVKSFHFELLWNENMFYVVVFFLVRFIATNTAKDKLIIAFKILNTE